MLNLRVHERDKKKPNFIKKFNHYVRLNKQDEVPLFFQNGQFHFENGEVINDPPDWAIEQMNNVATKIQKEVKYRKLEVKDDGDH